jgi:hypothetical protein
MRRLLTLTALAAVTLSLPACRDRTADAGTPASVPTVRVRRRRSSTTRHAVAARPAGCVANNPIAEALLCMSPSPMAPPGWGAGPFEVVPGTTLAPGASGSVLVRLPREPPHRPVEGQGRARQWSGPARCRGVDRVPRSRPGGPGRRAVAWSWHRGDGRPRCCDGAGGPANARRCGPPVAAVERGRRLRRQRHGAGRWGRRGSRRGWRPSGGAGARPAGLAPVRRGWRPSGGAGARPAGMVRSHVRRLLGRWTRRPSPLWPPSAGPPVRR